MSDMAARLSDREMAELCALADGTLPSDRRAAVEAWVADSPELQELLLRQRRSLAATQATAGDAPSDPLRLAVEAQVGERSRGRVQRLVPRLALAGAAVATAAVAAVIVLGGGTSGPSVADAAELAAMPPSGQAPARLEGSRTVLAAEVEGAQFPDLQRSYGWRPAGIREDTIDGRDATTVYYRKGGREIAYVIVAGSGLPPPDDAKTTVNRGVEYRTLQVDGQPTVTWERVGHTCVLTGDASPAELLALASWRGGGSLSY